MTGTELRAWRTSRGLYQRDVVRILTDAGLEAIDQPTISEYERGILEVPAEAGAALAAVAADYPVTGSPTPAPAPRKPKRESRKKEPEPEPEAVADDAEIDPQDAPANDDDGDDRPPRPVQPAGRREQTVRSVAWDAGVRSQLEKDLTVLFAGDSFLVPVPVVQDDGSVVQMMEEAAVPGIAQLVGFVDEYDGMVIQMNAAQMARAWAALADESPTVRRWLILLTYGGAWRGVIAATLPVVYSIGVHHGIIPPVLGGAGAAPQRLEPTDGLPVG